MHELKALQRELRSLATAWRSQLDDHRAELADIIGRNPVDENLPHVRASI